MIRGLRDYAKAKEDVLTRGLQPRRSRRRTRAEMVRAGIGLWWNVSSAKALQISLNPGVAPHQSAGVECKVEGNGVFSDTSNDSYSCVIDGVRRPHPHTGISCGTFHDPDGPHESNHNDGCRERNVGLPGCIEIAGLNLNPHEQNHARKGIHLDSLNTMTFPNFTYLLRVLNSSRSKTRSTIGKPQPS